MLQIRVIIVMCPITHILTSHCILELHSKSVDNLKNMFIQIIIQMFIQMILILYKYFYILYRYTQ